MKNNQEYKFFLIIPPGLESLGSQELTEKVDLFNLSSVKILKKEKGGLEITALAPEGMALNRILKIPTRILLRIDQFVARDLPKLFNKISNIKWNDYIYSSDVSIRASASKSRLIHTDRISDALTDGLKKYFKTIEIKKKFKESPYTGMKHIIYISINDDQVTLSIDTSGDPLYKRGLLKEKDKFTLRENFVSACIMQIKDQINKSNTLHDPMCGSATILSEINNFYTVSKRKYNFELFTKPALKKLETDKKFEIKVSGSDINDKLFNSGLKNGLELVKSDMFDLENKYDMILTHPPYGKNTSVKNSDTKGVFTKLKELSKNSYFIIDQVNFNHLKKDFKLTEVLRFKNQGTDSVLGKIDN